MRATPHEVEIGAVGVRLNTERGNWREGEERAGAEGRKDRQVCTKRRESVSKYNTKAATSEMKDTEMGAFLNKVASELYNHVKI